MSLLLPSGFRKQFFCALGHGMLTEDSDEPETYYCRVCTERLPLIVPTFYDH